MEDKNIRAVKQWPEPQLVQDISIFLKFTNFYRRFIHRFSQIALLLIIMLKISSTKLAKPRKGGVGVGDDSKARRDGSKLDRSKLDRSKIDGIEVDRGEIRENKVEKKVQKMSKSKNLSKSKKTVGSDFLILETRLTFTKLRQAFVKALILYHFDPEYHIQVKIDVSGYAIGKVLSHLTSEGQQHPMAFFSCKMIPVETRYETYNGELLVIIKAFKS